jgi:transcriptional regulator with XRE-family HTH domain
MGQRIRQRRLDLGLTQVELADQLGCSSTCVMYWETDKSVPLAKRWAVIVRLLGDGLVPYEPDLPRRIRAARRLHGLTQAELAARAGLHARTIRNAEQGRFQPFPKTLARLRTVLGKMLDQPGT